MSELQSPATGHRSTLFLCCGDGEGTHEFRVCATEQEVFDFYEYLCGKDEDGTVNSIKEPFADEDCWRNGGTAFELELYCANFYVWKVDPSEVATSAPSERAAIVRVFEEKPVAWLIERPKGLGKEQTMQHEVVLSPLTDDTFIDEGDAAYPLFREVYTQEQLDAAGAEATRIHSGLRIE